MSSQSPECALACASAGEAWRAKSIKNRVEFFRGAIGHYLAHLGTRDAAALFTNAGTMDA